VELQAKPLREFPELGTLPETEQELQALMLYTNPRQAKRQCGRTQRVIKVPDAGVLERRSSYLVAQGITRLVVEGGSLFALAGS
jgi:riboflavin biosynthesis pyrimidine reductase